MTIAHVCRLQDFLDHAPTNQFTIRWLPERLNRRAPTESTIWKAFAARDWNSFCAQMLIKPMSEEGQKRS
jgi:hypothetical protein